jgi:exodeoxyribonuclease VII small subunit
MKREITYQEATEKINHILKELEAGNIGIDALHAKVKEAHDLLAFCHKKLREIDTSLKNVDNSDSTLEK